jgi:hypothetical protein
MGVSLSSFDRNEDLLESALAVLLANIDMLRFVHLDMAPATDVLSYLDTRCRCVETEAGYTRESGLNENPELTRVTARYAVKLVKPDG